MSRCDNFYMIRKMRTKERKDKAGELGGVKKLSKLIEGGEKDGFFR